MTFYLQLMRNKWLSPTGNILFQLENIKILKGWESPLPLAPAPSPEKEGEDELRPWLWTVRRLGEVPMTRVPSPLLRPVPGPPCEHCSLSSLHALLFSSPCLLVVESLMQFNYLDFDIQLFDLTLTILTFTIYMEILKEQKDDWLKILAANCEFI